MLGLNYDIIDRILEVGFSIISRVPIILGVVASIALPFYRERIAIYWKSKFSIRITANCILWNMSVVNHNGISPKMEFLNGKPTLDGKNIEEVNFANLIPQTKSKSINFIKGSPLDRINVPYINIHIKNIGYNDFSLDDFFITLSPRRYHSILKQSSDSIIYPVSVKYTYLLCNDINDEPPKLPCEIKPGKDIKFRIDPNILKHSCMLSIEQEPNNKIMRRCYLAFTALSGNYIMTQCSRIKITAFSS